jgi:tRNA (cytidine/uridine-2'-O-)-methyltransferase
MAFHIVLVEPLIPANTGNISRTCAATGAYLHLVKPLGFSTDDRYLKRAGLDYWDAVKLEYHDSLKEVEDQYKGSRFFYVETTGEHLYTDFQYREGDFFVFGKETAGLPKEVVEANKQSCIRMPMSGDVRSLNLSNSAAVILYEALRQVGFPNLT